MKKYSMLIVGVLLLLSSCKPDMILAPEATATAYAIWLEPPHVSIKFITPTHTETAPPTQAVTPLSTPTWIAHGPGNVTVPILLYHHVDISTTANRYYVAPELFEQEMKALQGWGYTTISTTMLVQAITQGRQLPAHPILITFDDGSLDNYTTAFPIMEQYGFTGVLYLVERYIGTEGYLNRDQILEMHAAGWEVGSHSLNHLDLTTLLPDDQLHEIYGSKQKLEEKLGIEILTFAYPFGAKSEPIMGMVQSAGYMAAMGADGFIDSQGFSNLFNLQRVEIKGSEDAESFRRFLSWHGLAE